MIPVKKMSTETRWHVSRRDFIRAGTLLAMNALSPRHFDLHGETCCDATKESPRQIAFLADIHYHDVYATFGEGSFQGIKGPDGRNATIRTMSAQLTSTRLFNENYFAFRAALDRVVARGIKLVVLAGDFSDDGQPVHMRGLKQVLDDYTMRYGIRFMVTFGNHDPVKPFGQPHGKHDFLGEGGKQQPVISRELKMSKNWQNDDTLPPYVSEEIRALGYEGLLEYMGPFGPYPNKEDVYWECPFSKYSYAEYTFKRAFAEARFENRMYMASGDANPSLNNAASIRIPDLSYLAEPVEGIWLLGIDANVFMLSRDVDFDNPGDPANFVSAGNAGWNRMLVEKKAVLTWIKSVVARAATLNKQLIAFSHYPMLDTMRGAGPDIAAFLEAGRDQPAADTMREIAATGLRLHFGGHLHKNNTAVYQSEDAFLADVQIPSIAAYMPAFKILTLHSGDCAEIETVVLDDVPDFDKLFEHYRAEHELLAQTKSPALWDARILESKNYREFTQWHLMELTRRRYLPQEWPKDMRGFFETLTGTSLLTLLALNTDIRIQDVGAIAGSEPELITKLSCRKLPDGAKENVHLKKLVADWHAAEKVVMQELKKNGTFRESIDDIDGLRIAADFHRLLNAGGSLAAKDIEPGAHFYSVAKALADASAVSLKSDVEPKSNASMPVGMNFKRRFFLFLNILRKLSEGLPNDHFMIDFRNRDIRAVYEDASFFMTAYYRRPESE
jgi:3',5'-cyclic AMP phosphodiesterase CpdA